jgi:hypothetical protein
MQRRWFSTARLQMALSLLMVSCAFARGDETGRDANQLKVALSLNVVTNGVATSRDGRIFMTIVRMDGSGGVALYLNRRLASEGIHELSAARHPGLYREVLEALQRSGESQISLTDPDAGAMAADPEVGVGYNT